MAQFDVHKNPNPASAKAIPYLLDVQSDLLSELSTRVVVPLAYPEAIANKPAHVLNPLLDISGKKLVMLTPETAGISVKRLGEVVASARGNRNEIIRAIDIVFSGI